MQQMIYDLTYMPKGHTGHLCPTKLVVEAWQQFFDICPFTNILEFGFNTGWSSALLLTMFPNVKITSIEIEQNKNSLLGASVLQEKFPNRHKIIWADSQKLAIDTIQNKKNLLLDTYDLAFIDGGHFPDIVRSDINLSLHLKIKNFVFDDINKPNVYLGIKEYSQLKLICEKYYHETKYKNKGFIFKNNKINLSYFQFS